MLKRSTLALYTALFLLVSLLAFSGGPALVCRVTGEQMQPVMAKALDGKDTCCTVAAFVSPDPDPDRHSGYAIIAPGCCDLRQSTERPAPPSALAPQAPELPAFVLARVPSVVLIPRLSPVVLITAVSWESVLRPPPALSSVSPRAPPFFS